MPSALVSVIIPVYSHEGYVQETLKSIIEQTFQSIELIVLNDGSKDNSHQKVVEIREACEQRFVNFVYVDKENEGIIKTLNRGLELASAPYVYIIASDDIAEKNAIETLYQFLSVNPDYGLVVGGNKLIDSDSQLCFWDAEREIVYSGEETFYTSFDDMLRKSRSNVDFLSDQFGTYQNLLIDNHIPNGYLLRRSILDDFGGYSVNSPMEDLYMMLQISKRAKLKFLDTPLFKYRWHAGNTIKNHIKMYQIQRKTINNEFAYCVLNGYFIKCLKQTYIPDIKFYFKKVKQF